MTAMSLQSSAKYDTVQMAVKIHDPLKGKAYLKASLLTSKWLGIQTVRETGAPGVEKLTPERQTQCCYLKRCCPSACAVGRHHAVC